MTIPAEPEDGSYVLVGHAGGGRVWQRDDAADDCSDSPWFSVDDDCDTTSWELLIQEAKERGESVILLEAVEVLVRGRH